MAAVADEQSAALSRPHVWGLQSKSLSQAYPSQNALTPPRL